MRKILPLLALLLLFALPPPAYAAARPVGIVIAAPAPIAADDGIQRIAETQAARIFPAPAYALLPLDLASRALALVGEENGLAVPNEDGISYQPLKTEHLKAISALIEADFLIYARIYNSDPVSPKSYNPYGAAVKQMTFFTELRIFSREKGKSVHFVQDSSVYSKNSLWHDIHTVTNCRRSLDKTFKKLIAANPKF